MIEITSVVTGDKQVVAHFNALPANVRRELTQALLRITIDLQSHVVKNKLSGQLLKRRTGTLAASMQHKVNSTTNGVIGVVGSRINESAPLKYARPLEDGFEGTVTVREHLRQMTKAWGRAVKEPRKITVGEHTAHRSTKAYKYLASSLAERRADYIKMIEKAVADGSAQ